jgi:hypothetical protein
MFASVSSYPETDR